MHLVQTIIGEGYLAEYRHLHITGGEPLLWRELYRALDYAFHIGYHTVFLNTNGTLLTDRICGRLAAYDGLSISVSLEGPEALHDQMRGEGSYRRTVQGIERALDAGIDLFLFTTARKALIQNLPHFTSEIYRRFPALNSLITIQLIRVTDDIFDLSEELLKPDDFLEFVRIVSLLNLYGLKTYVLSNPLASVAAKMIEMPWIPYLPPPYRPGSIFVMANRDITLSHSSRSSFGKYEQGMIGQVLNSEEYLNATAPDTATCPTCEYHRLCVEDGMVRPSEWFRDSSPEVPFCRRVLDRATGRYRRMF
jgi:sulfatase maturation enzyme AslB (radical SAM superfamily)